MKVLNVVQTGYRATIEEQDDTMVWICHAMKGAGSDLDVLLQGHAVNYAIKGQDASGLTFGDKAQTQPPKLERDIEALLGKGVAVYIVEEDLQQRGIEPGTVIEGLTTMSVSDMPKLYDKYDQIWRW